VQVSNGLLDAAANITLSGAKLFLGIFIGTETEKQATVSISGEFYSALCRGKMNKQNFNEPSSVKACYHSVPNRLPYIILRTTINITAYKTIILFVLYG
jgi:hypothetical protein